MDHLIKELKLRLRAAQAKLMKQMERVLSLLNLKNEIQNLDIQSWILTNHNKNSSDPKLVRIYLALPTFEKHKKQQFLAMQESAKAARRFQSLPTVEAKLIRMVKFY